MVEKIITLVSRVFSIEQCRTNPGTVFIFGDNSEVRAGMGGQAIIREQINAIGIATKKFPGNAQKDYFYDNEYEQNCKIIDEDIERIKAYIKEQSFKAVCFPKMGVGTGRAELQKRAPLTFCYLTERLIKEWEFNNLEFLESKQF